MPEYWPGGARRIDGVSLDCCSCAERENASVGTDGRPKMGDVCPLVAGGSLSRQQPKALSTGATPAGGPARRSDEAPAPWGCATCSPGILVMTAASGAESTALGVNADMGEGIIARFQTMAIWRPCVLASLRPCRTGDRECRPYAHHGCGSVLARTPPRVLAERRRPRLARRHWAPRRSWQGALVAHGCLRAAGEDAGGSKQSLARPACAPVREQCLCSDRHDARRRAGLCRYQPFSSIIDTFRSLLTGTPMGHHGLVAVAWFAGIAVVGFVWAVKLYNRDSPIAA